MNIKVLSLLFVVMITGLFSCKQNDLPLPVNPATPFNVVNASGDTINFFVNGTRQYNLSSIYPGGATGYLNIAVGAQSYWFKKAGSPDILFSYPYKLDTATDYSTFVAGESAAKTFLTTDSLGLASYILSTDTTYSTCMLRFVNASAQAQNLDISLTDSSKVVINAKDKQFTYAGPFVKIKAGAQEEVKVYQAGGSTAEIDTTLSLQTGTIYTLFTKGVIGGRGGSAFTVGLISNY